MQIVCKIYLSNLCANLEFHSDRKFRFSHLVKFVFPNVNCAALATAANMSEDECNVTEKNASIDCLPSEIISIILKHNDCRDSVNFSATCKYFYEMVQSDQCLWKERFKEIVPPDLFKSMIKNGDGDWFTETKRLTTIKKLIYERIANMSPEFFCRPNCIQIEDIRSIFDLALSHNVGFYFVVHTIQDLVKRTKKSMQSLSCQKPFTLTEMYYGRVALRHLMHTYLSLKWASQRINKEQYPHRVLNFFIQWIDNDHLYPDDVMEEKINTIITKVEKLMQEAYPGPQGTHYTVREMCDKGFIPHRNVIAATSYIMYGEMRMTLATSANIDTLNIVKVLNNKCGHSIALAAIYLAIVKSFGVDCELVTFPNHMFLEWRTPVQREIIDPSSPYICTADLKTGLWNPRRRCPFSGNVNTNYSYHPESLLQYIYASFYSTMGAIKNWQTQNAVHLLDFVSGYNNYRNFLPYLLDSMHLRTINIPLDHKYLHELHIQLIHELTSLNKTQRTKKENVTVKKRDSCVRFAVGMICCHQSYGFICLVRGWDLTCAAEWQGNVDLQSLEYGYNQPFYNVIAADLSERYIAQENLIESSDPNRLAHLEDFIGYEFTHFDGFSYVPNDEKKAEYPNDMPVVSTYRQHWEMYNGRGTYFMIRSYFDDV